MLTNVPLCAILQIVIINHQLPMHVILEGGITTKKLALMRERAKLTQRELADVLGVERSTVAKWESGAAYPRASQLPALAKALGCSIDELYSREEESA
mgnify:FL=1